MGQKKGRTGWPMKEKAFHTIRRGSVALEHGGRDRVQPADLLPKSIREVTVV